MQSFLTTTPNELIAAVHPSRMPVMLTTEDEFDCWLNGSPEEARILIRSYPPIPCGLCRRARSGRTWRGWVEASTENSATAIGPGCRSSEEPTRSFR